jgi:hypothetical protein
MAALTVAGWRLHARLRRQRHAAATVAYPVRRPAGGRLSWRLCWEEMVERIILALRSDFGCLVIIVAFVVIMISTIVFANIITPPSNNPFV